MSKNSNAVSLSTLAGKACAFVAAVVMALGMVLGFATPAIAATKYVEADTFEQGKNYILVAATVDSGSGYAIQLGSSNKDNGSGGRTSLPSVKVNITEGSIASVTTDDAKLVWNARSVNSGGVQLYCDVELQETNQEVDNRPSHYLYPASQCLKTQDQCVRDIRWQDKQFSVSTTSGSRYYITCDANGNLGTATSGAATFRIFVEDDGTSDVPVDGITLNQTSMELIEGMVAYLEATVTPDDATDKTVSWTSSNESVAKVDSEGAVQAVSAGTATITATAGEKSATCAVTVKPEVHEVTWERVAGGTRYATMAEIVKKGFTSASVAVLATGKAFPDALMASSLAGALDAPLILTAPTKLSTSAEEQLTSLGVKRVYIVGGESAVSADVEEAVKGMNISVTRVAGDSRQATSIAAMEKINELGKFSGKVVIATGYNFADALSIGPWCYKTGTPILLTNKAGKLTDDQAEAAKALGVNGVIIVGGELVVDDAVASQLDVSAEAVERLAGDNRYETSSKIADWEMAHDMGMTNVTVATGQNFPDALAGSALCGVKNSVMILVKNKDSVSLKLIAEKKDLISVGYVLGGEDAVSADLFSYLESITK